MDAPICVRLQEVLIERDGGTGVVVRQAEVVADLLTGIGGRCASEPVGLRTPPAPDERREAVLGPEEHTKKRYPILIKYGILFLIGFHQRVVMELLCGWEPEGGARLVRTAELRQAAFLRTLPGQVVQVLRVISRRAFELIALT